MYSISNFEYIVFHAVVTTENLSITNFSASTAFHAQELGFRTVLVDDCSRGINSADIEKTKEKIKENNGCVIHSNEVHYLTFFQKHMWFSHSCKS